MSNPIRCWVLAAGALTLSLLAAARPARAEALTTFTAIFAATSTLPPPPPEPAEITGGEVVDTFYLATGVVTSPPPPSVVFGMALSNIQIDLSSKDLSVFLSDPNGLLPPPPNRLTIFDASFLPLAVFDINPSDPGRGFLDVLPGNRVVITAPVTLLPQDPVFFLPPPPELDLFFIPGAMVIIEMDNIAVGSATFPTPPGTVTTATVTFVAVPEPGSLALCLLGAAAVGGWRVRGRLSASRRQPNAALKI